MEFIARSASTVPEAIPAPGYHHDVSPRWARPWFAATAICAVVGIVVSVITAHKNVNGFFDDPIQRGANALAFFTVQSNIIVAVTTGLLARGSIGLRCCSASSG